jgi:pseudo-response regulator 1
MSNRDDVSVVVKCLRLGAAEYLVKPLRMNELLNLWTHVWRRRRMVNDTLLFTFTCVKSML